LKKINVFHLQHIYGGRDRQRPAYFELALSLPPRAQCDVRVDFERAFLRWNEYPPDAHKGFDVPPVENK
jgi:phosphatidylinositol glycan class T